MDSRHTPRVAGATRVLIVAAPLYFAWEMAQAAAFTGTPRAWPLSTLLCAVDR